MKKYIIQEINLLKQQNEQFRANLDFALQILNIEQVDKYVNYIFNNVRVIDILTSILTRIENEERKQRNEKNEN